MQKHLFFLFLIVLILGCGQPKEKSVFARINNYEITREEFQEEFAQSSYSGTEDLTEKEEFLNQLIRRKLILQDAQRRGLDKKPEFLKMIEKFWEQSLLKLALEKKAAEISGSVLVSDKEIKEAYQKMAQEGKTVKSYSQMYQQLKWELTRFKESEEMDAWIAELQRQANIKINTELLKYDK